MSSPSLLRLRGALDSRISHFSSLEAFAGADNQSLSKPTISPTDQMQSPCTAKLSGAKQRHFAKWVKPLHQPP